VSAINVFCAGAVKSALIEALRGFEQHSGHTVQCTFGSTGSLRNKIVAGELADVILMSRSPVEQLAHQGWVLADTIADVGRVGVGVAVRANAALPDVSTPDALRASLRAARSITFGDPSKGDSSGIHFAKVIETLGIKDELSDKIVLAPLGLAVAELIDQGKVELGATQATVILACNGIVLAGLLPEGLQHITTYALGVVSDSGVLPAAHKLADYLAAPAAKACFRAAGFA
jgi:molybdate transport system substrate-binding protein